MAIIGVGLTTGDFAPRLRDLPACLDRFEKLGVDSVELSLGAFDVVAGGRVLPRRLAELKQICADRPFGFTLHGPLAGRFTDRRHMRLQIDVCRAALEVSATLGARVQVHHAGAAPMDDAAECAALRALECEALAELAPHAAAGGVVLCVENVVGDPGELLASPAELAAQIRQVDHPNIRATIDFSHAAINAGMRGFDLMAELHELAPLAAHLHIHDSFGRPRSFRPFNTGDAVAFGLGDLHLPPGWGALDWNAFAALPYAADVVANLEQGTRFEDTLEESVALCRRMAETSRGLG